MARTRSSLRNLERARLKRRSAGMEQPLPNTTCKFSVRRRFRSPEDEPKHVRDKHSKMSHTPSSSGDHEKMTSHQDVRKKLSKMSLTPSASGDHEKMTSHQDDASGSKTGAKDGLVVPWGVIVPIWKLVDAMKNPRSWLPCQVYVAECRVCEMVDHYKTLGLLPMEWEFNKDLAGEYKPPEVESEDEDESGDESEDESEGEDTTDDEITDV